MSDRAKKDQAEGLGDKPQPAEKPVSLHPLSFKEALRDLLRVRPDSKSTETDETT